MIAQITPAEFDAWLADAATRGRPVLLDVREPWEVQTASARAGEGFDLLTIPMATIPPRLSEVPADRPIACLCHHGARSQRVAMFLAQNGYIDVVNVAGGIDAWSLQKDPAVPRY